MPGELLVTVKLQPGVCIYLPRFRCRILSNENEGLESGRWEASLKLRIAAILVARNSVARRINACLACAGEMVPHSWGDTTPRRSKRTDERRVGTDWILTCSFRRAA